MTTPYNGIHVTQTCGLNALLLLQQPLNLADSHVPIVARLATTLRIAIFATQLHNLLLSNQSPDQLSTMNPAPQSARTLITPHVLEHPVGTCTNVNTAEVTTLAGHAPTIGACTRPLPWTLLRPLILEWELSKHPDKAFVKQLIYDLQHGCDISYLGPQFAHLTTNLASTSRQPEVIDAALLKECEVGRILGPFQTSPLPNFRASGLGLVPKHDGGWRVIYHLSVPVPHSINDYMDPDSYSLTYRTIDDTYSIINKLGSNALLSKIDLKDAFRLIPVCPEDWNLLGIQWRQYFYVDTCLPFGLRSAPFLFNRLLDAIHWVLHHNYGVKHLLHYLDDFFTAGAANTDDCMNNLTAMLSLCKKINAPVKSSKVEGHSTSLTFLLDTTTMEASITQERKQALLSELAHLRYCRNCTKHALLSLIGKLSFCCKGLPLAAFSYVGS